MKQFAGRQDNFIEEREILEQRQNQDVEDEDRSVDRFAVFVFFSHEQGSGPVYEHDRKEPQIDPGRIVSAAVIERQAGDQQPYPLRSCRQQEIYTADQKEKYEKFNRDQRHFVRIPFRR